MHSETFHNMESWLNVETWVEYGNTYNMETWAHAEKLIIWKLGFNEITTHTITDEDRSVKSTSWNKVNNLHVFPCEMKRSPPLRQR